MKKKIHRNIIMGLYRSGGRLVQVEKVKMEIKNHFESRFKEPKIMRPLLEGVIFKQSTLKERNLLEAPFLVDEIKEVVWQGDVTKVMDQIDIT